MREAAKVAKFGSVIPITGSDFVREVSQAPSDVWVVVILYKEGYFMRDLNTKLSFFMRIVVMFVMLMFFLEFSDRIPECTLLMRCLEELATKYPATKFVKIISTDCIPNYPDRNLPTLIVYNNGSVKANHVGIHSFGRRCTPEGMLYLSMPHILISLRITLLLLLITYYEYVKCLGERN